MPSVMDAPELDIEIEDVETHDLTIETIKRPPTRRVRSEFWRALARGIITYLTPTRRAWHAPSCHVSHRFETPMDRLVREHPSLAIYALAMI
jgi:hypothetical protein